MISNEEQEILASSVHKAYCRTYCNQFLEPYWTGGDYEKLSECSKKYDRATVKAVLDTLFYLGFRIEKG